MGKLVENVHTDWSADLLRADVDQFIRQKLLHITRDSTLGKPTVFQLLRDFYADPNGPTDPTADPEAKAEKILRDYSHRELHGSLKQRYKKNAPDLKAASDYGYNDEPAGNGKS